MKSISSLVVLLLCVSALLASQVKTMEENSKSVRNFGNGRLVSTLENSVDLKRRETPRRFLLSYVGDERCRSAKKDKNCHCFVIREALECVYNPPDDNDIGVIAKVDASTHLGEIGEDENGTADDG